MAELLRAVELAARPGHHRGVVHGSKRDSRVAPSARDRQRLLRHLDDLRLVAAPHAHRAGADEHPRAQEARPRPAVQRRVDPARAFHEVGAREPEAPHAGRELLRLLRVVRECRAQRGAQVVVLDLEALGRLLRSRALSELRVGALGQREVPGAVAHLQGHDLLRLVQALARVLADDLEQPVAVLGAVRLDRHQRLVRQPGEQVDDIAARDAVAPAHALGGRQPERRRRTRPAGGRAPARRRSSRSWLQSSAARRVWRRVGAVRAPPVSRPSASESRSASCGGVSTRGAGRRQLDRQRHAVEPVADLDDRLGVVARPARSRARASVARSTNSRIAGERSSSSGAGSAERSGRPSEGTRQTISPSTWSGSRLVASTVTPGQVRSSSSTTAAQASTTCSQLSSTISSSRSRSCAASAAASGARGRGELDADRLGDRLHHELGLGDRRELHEPRAVAMRRHALGGHLEREPRLAAAARPGEREQPRALQARGDRRLLALAPDEARRAQGQVVRRRACARPRPPRDSPRRRSPAARGTGAGSRDRDPPRRRRAARRAAARTGQAPAAGARRRRRRASARAGPPRAAGPRRRPAGAPRWPARCRRPRRAARPARSGARCAARAARRGAPSPTPRKRSSGRSSPA